MGDKGMEDEIEIGDEVICINSAMKPGDKEFILRNYPVWIKEGDKYIVRDVFNNDGIVVGIVLVNRRNPPVYIPLLKRMQEPAFAYFRFKKGRTASQISEQEEGEAEEAVHKLLEEHVDLI
jgi:hypothetical protein